MADSSQLASILSGTDPLSPQMLDALHAEQARDYVANPANWQNQGIAGAVGRTLAALLVPNNTGTVANIAAQRVAAQPDTVAAYNDPSGPLAYAAGHANMNPLSLAQVLAQGPEAAQNYIEAARLGRANSPGAQPLVSTGGATLPGWDKIAAPSGAPTAAAPHPATPTADLSILGSGRYQQPDQTAASDPLSMIAATPPQQRPGVMGNMSPAQRAALIARYRASMGARGNTLPGGQANAVRPPT